MNDKTEFFQYIDGLVSDFDLLVIGGYYNPSNKFIYKYLLGVQKKLSSSSKTDTILTSDGRRLQQFSILQKRNSLL